MADRPGPRRSPMLWAAGTAIALMSGPPATSSEPIRLPEFSASPVFMETASHSYADTANLVLMPAGRIAIAPHGERDISEFNWVDKTRVEVTWLLDMEELAYLVPLIRSPRGEHRALAAAWYRKWEEAHRDFKRPNRAAWDAMSAGIRAMVLVMFYRHVMLDPEGHEPLGESLLASIASHQHFLAKEANFQNHSNHAMWQAVGLIETCRVIPDERLARLGFDRFAEFCRAIVSEEGIQREHAVGYHFKTLEWISDFTAYLHGIPGLRWDGLAEIDALRDRMARAAYYLYDHAGYMPPIGDAFRARVKDRWRIPAGESTPEILFDADGGFVCYKERPGRADRYVVMNIQTERPIMPHHLHDDGLAVVCVIGGDMLFGDQGGFDYGRGQYRRYVVSAAAHNLPLPEPAFMDGRAPGKGWESRRVHGPWVNGAGGVSFGGLRKYASGTVARTVHLPDGAASVRITDEITSEESFVVLWHLGPGVRAAAAAASQGPNESCWRLTAPSGGAYLVSFASENGERPAVEKVVGGGRPMVGWYSPAFRRIEKAAVLIVRTAGTGPHTLHTTVTKTGS